MNDKFDELAKSMAQSVTRRGALKKFGVGLAGLALALLGLANKAHANRYYHCNCNKPGYGCDNIKDDIRRNLCYQNCPAVCGF